MCVKEIDYLYQIHFKVFILMFKSLNSLGPTYVQAFSPTVSPKELCIQKIITGLCSLAEERSYCPQQKCCCCCCYCSSDLIDFTSYNGITQISEFSGYKNVTD